MRKIGTRLFICIFVIFIAAVALVVFEKPSGTTAHADDIYINITAITKLNKDGERVPYETGLFSRTVQIELALNSPSLKVEIHEDIGGKLELLDYYSRGVSSGTAVVNINYNGNLRVVLIAERANGEELKRLERNILSDNQPPPAPQLDATQLEVYRNNPFNLAYTLVRDAHSEIDGVRSSYTFTDTNGTVRLTNNFGMIDYNERFIPGINTNGTIRFELYDKAGNKGVYEYVYSRYGIPESSAPVVSVTPDYGFAREVNISISWGSDYDTHPLARKEYTLINAFGTYRKQYKEPFSVTTEGAGTLIVYYYQNGVEKSVSVTLPRIDRTPPGVETISSSFAVYCDLTSTDMPLYASLRVTDGVSGIKEVRFGSGEVFENYEENLYKGNIIDKPSFVIVAEDNAGNITEYTVLGLDYDYEGIAEYANMFARLRQEDYSPMGWSKVMDAFRTLGMDFIMDSNQLSVSKRRAVEAVDIGISFTTRLNTIPEGLSGAMSFDISPVGLKKGDIVTIYIDKVSGTTAEVSARGSNAKILADMPNVYSFNLSATNSEDVSVAIQSGGQIEVVLPQGTKYAAIYYYDNDKLEKLESSLLANGRLLVTINSFGDFYITTIHQSEEPPSGLVIGGKFYSSKLLAITAAIVVGGSLLAGLIMFAVSKKKRR